jgi:hypothetical protein
MRGSPHELSFFNAHLCAKRTEKINMKDQPKKIRVRDYGLFIVKVSIERGKLIEELMTDDAKQATGLNKLTDQELANLNSWLDPGKVLAVAPASEEN